jgi:GMP synthase-like glutamine amidotransferase
MKIHLLQHVDFEGPGEIGTWVDMRNHDITIIRMYDGVPLPSVGNTEGLIIMGGPMSVNDTAEFPWLVDEIEYVRDAISRGVRTLGVCLGAQILARACGVRVYKNAEKEIGWFPVFRKGAAHFLFTADIPETMTVFHWHGETFDLPEGACLHYSSEGCGNQCFTIRSALALQFHLEMNSAGIVGMIENCGNELTDGTYIQSIDEIKEGFERHREENTRVLVDILDGFFGRT